MDNEKRFTGVRHALRFKIAFIVVSVTLLTLIFGLIISRSIIEHFFRRQTRTDLVNAYNYCNDLFNEAEKNGYSISEIQDRLLFLYNDSKDTMNMLVFIVDKNTFTIYYSVALDQEAANNIRKIINYYDFDEIRESEKGYIIESTTKDEFGGSNNKDEFFDLIGVLDNGNIIIIRRPVDAIVRVYKYVVKLFAVVFSGLILVELIAVVLISAVFSRPIVKMSHAAKRMSELDFDTKIEVKSRDEIGVLGNSMNELSEKLEKTISELKTANAKLESDIENRERIDEMRKEFISHASHELKTPIALIQGYAEGLKDNVSDDPESMDFYCDVIIDEASKMNKLVMNMLNLSELEFGEDNISIQRFDLTALINDVLKASTIMIEQSAASEVIFNETEACNAWADEFMIEEVITNYLTNALHYVKPEGKIKVYYEYPAKNKVRVNVYNDGPNIKEDELDKLFIKFYKTDAARTREYGGSGIGLSIVEVIMKRHKNNYGVYNTEGGVVFFFELDIQERINTPGKTDKKKEKNIDKDKDKLTETEKTSVNSKDEQLQNKAQE